MKRTSYELKANVGIKSQSRPEGGQSHLEWRAQVSGGPGRAPEINLKKDGCRWMCWAEFAKETIQKRTAIKKLTNNLMLVLMTETWMALTGR